MGSHHRASAFAATHLAHLRRFAAARRCVDDQEPWFHVKPSSLREAGSPVGMRFFAVEQAPWFHVKPLVTPLQGSPTARFNREWPKDEAIAALRARVGYCR
jgi:hypothetical protein